MITVTAAASSRKLATLALLKEDLSITVSDNDTALNRILDQASSMITRYCGREFARETIVETLPGNGKFTLLLTRTPIVSISAITYDGVTVSADDYSIREPEAGIIYNRYGWNETARASQGLSQNPILSSRENLYSVTYVAGYILPSFTDPAGANLPYDIERACLDIAKGYWVNPGINTVIQSESVPDVASVTYRDMSQAGAMPAHVREILDSWKRYA